MSQNQRRGVQVDILDVMFENLEGLVCSETDEYRQPEETTEEGNTSTFSLENFLERIEGLALTMNAFDGNTFKASVTKVFEKYVEDLECVAQKSERSESKVKVDALDSMFEWLEEISCKRMESRLLGKEAGKDVLDTFFDRFENAACANGDELVEDHKGKKSENKETPAKGRTLLSLQTSNLLPGWTQKAKCIQVRTLLSMSDSTDDMRSETQSLYKISEEPSDYFSAEEMTSTSHATSSHSRQQDAKEEKIDTRKVVEQQKPQQKKQQRNDAVQIDFRRARGTVHPKYSKKNIARYLSTKMETTLDHLQSAAKEIDIETYMACPTAGVECHSGKDLSDKHVGDSAESKSDPPPHLNPDPTVCKEDSSQKLHAETRAINCETVIASSGSASPVMDTINGRVRPQISNNRSSPVLGIIDGRVRTRQTVVSLTTLTRQIAKSTPEDSVIDTDMEDVMPQRSESNILSTKSYESSLPQLPSSATSDDSSYFKWDLTPIRSWGYRSSRRVVQASSSETVKHSNRIPAFTVPHPSSLMSTASPQLTHTEIDDTKENPIRSMSTNSSDEKLNTNSSDVKLNTNSSDEKLTTSLRDDGSSSSNSSSSRSSLEMITCISVRGASEDGRSGRSIPSPTRAPSDDDSADSIGKPFDEALNDKSMSNRSIESLNSQGPGNTVAVNAGLTASLSHEDIFMQHTTESEKSETDAASDAATSPSKPDPDDIESRVKTQDKSAQITSSVKVTNTASKVGSEEDNHLVEDYDRHIAVAVACLSGLELYVDASEDLISAVPSLDIVPTSSIPDCATLSHDETESLKDVVAVDASRISTAIQFQEAMQGDNNPALKMLLMLMWMSMSFLLDVNGKVNGDFEKRRKKIQNNLGGNDWISSSEIISVIRKHVSASMSTEN